MLFLSIACGSRYGFGEADFAVCNEVKELWPAAVSVER
jgi:hypothetical protein